MTALYWIMNKGEWKQFVHHRVNEILRLTNKEEWGHCSGVENPADIGSRSCMGSQLVKNKLWWEGPDWLRKTSDGWPKFEANEKTSTVIEEQKRSAVMLVKVTQPRGIISSILDIKVFGTAERLFRVTAWILRFISNIKVKVKKGKHCRSTSDLNVVELEEAERVWVKEAQAVLKRSERYGQMRNSLGIEEEEGILRCEGRFYGSPDATHLKQLSIFTFFIFTFFIFTFFGFTFFGFIFFGFTFFGFTFFGFTFFSFTFFGFIFFGFTFFGFTFFGFTFFGFTFFGFAFFGFTFFGFTFFGFTFFGFTFFGFTFFGFTFFGFTFFWFYIFWFHIFRYYTEEVGLLLAKHHE